MREHVCMNCNASSLSRWFCPDCWRIAIIGVVVGGAVAIVTAVIELLVGQ